MTSMRAHGLILVTVLAGAALVGAAGCLNAVPDRPSYERDIKPLMESHCIRCHGAGGTLNADPDIPLVSGVQKPNATDFTSLQGTNGHIGLMTFTGAAEPSFERFVNGFPAANGNPAVPGMPPPPADPLTNWEREMLFTWAKNPLP